MVALLCLFFSTFGAFAEKRMALVIGNAKYEKEVGALRNPVNDAKAIAKTLCSLNFSVNEEYNVKRDELLKEVISFQQKITDAEVALFYFAGHRISVEGSNYLLPIKSGYVPGTNPSSPLRMLAETKLFNADQIVAEMGNSGSPCNLIILDACRSTPVARNPSARDSTDQGGLSEMTPPAGSLIAFATDAGHTASDGKGKNGLYTGELIRFLATPGLTIEQVFKRTRAAVIEKSEGRQMPAEYSRLIGNDIYLAGIKPKEPEAPKAAPVTAPSITAINRLAAAGSVNECIEAIRLATAAKGKSDDFTKPIDALLENAKDTLKTAKGSSPKVRTIKETCRMCVDIIDECLPTTNARYNELTAKANNRLGDSLMLEGRPKDALASYHIAVRLAPEDPYPLYNRGRALVALGENEAARDDFQKVIGPKFNKPLAKRLAQEALKELE